MATKWVTREHPKIDRIARSLLIRALADPAWQSLAVIVRGAEAAHRDPVSQYDARALKGGIGAGHTIGGPALALDCNAYEA